MSNYAPPARTAHSGSYWLWVGWWWEPLKWIGRVSLWILMPIAGLWRSWSHSRSKRDGRERRGYQQAVKAQSAPSAPSAPALTSSHPAAWHPDPKGEARLRYWDGQRWTDHTAP